MIAEPILSVGGIVPLPPGLPGRAAPALRRARDAADPRRGPDRASAGPGACSRSSATASCPDILTLSKTLGGGLPLSATITSDEIEQDAFDKGFLHFTSHVSDPLPAAIGRAVLQTVVDERLAERAAALGERLRRGLGGAQRAGTSRSATCAARGLMLGVELVEDRDSRAPDPVFGTAVTERCLELGLNVNIVKFPALGSVLRLAPPLTISEADLDLGLEILDRALSDARSRAGAVLGTFLASR